MVDIYHLLLGLAALLLVIYFIVELNYFLRSLLCLIQANFFKQKKFILDETTISGICISNDVDYLLNHMNNARYARELDFAKLDFYQRTGLYKNVASKGGALFVGATTIRYRRFIKIFTKYQIKTKIIYWDNQNIYLEHQFLTKSGFVNAIAMCRIRLVKVDAEQIMKDLIENVPKKVIDIEAGKNKQKLTLSPELEKWIESNQISSEKLREKDKSKSNEEVGGIA